MPLLQDARELRDVSEHLGREAIERLHDRPPFAKLFDDVHSFSKSVGNVKRIISLAKSLADVVGDGTKPDNGLECSAALSEEASWQEATGSFLEKFRARFAAYYGDVVTGLCGALETCRIGLRLTSAAASRAQLRPHTSAVVHDGVSVAPVVRLQRFLLRFPYALEGDDVAAELSTVLGLHLGDEFQNPKASRSVHVALVLVSTGDRA